MRLNKLSVIAIALASPAVAQPYYGESPPVVVYAPPPPPVIAGQAIGGLIGGIVSLPFQILQGIFAPPPVPLVPDGQGGWVPETNSHYDPVTGQFLQPYAYQPPPAYAPQEPYYAPPATYAPQTYQGPPTTHRSSGTGHSGGAGCFASDGTRLRNTGECATNPQPIPDTSQWRELD